MTRRFTDHREIRKLHRYGNAAVRVDTARLRRAETPTDVLEAVQVTGPARRHNRSIAPLPKWARAKLNSIAKQVQAEAARKERLQGLGVEVVEAKVEKPVRRLPKLGKLLNPITGRPA